MGIAGLEGLPGEKRTQIDKLFVCIRYTITVKNYCTHVPSKGFNGVCCVVRPRMLLTVILAAYAVPACSPIM